MFTRVLIYSRTAPTECHLRSTKHEKEKQRIDIYPLNILGYLIGLAQLSQKQLIRTAVKVQEFRFFHLTQFKYIQVVLFKRPLRRCRYLTLSLVQGKCQFHQMISKTTAESLMVLHRPHQGTKFYVSETLGYLSWRIKLFPKNTDGTISLSLSSKITSPCVCFMSG